VHRAGVVAGLKPTAEEESRFELLTRVQAFAGKRQRLRVAAGWARDKVRHVSRHSSLRAACQQASLAFSGPWELESRHRHRPVQCDEPQIR
jgi:hypothetical protein